jgi:sec-independent protein translocase protein TatC
MTEEVEQGRAEGEMTLMEHLTELRQRIIKSVIAIAVGAVVCFIFKDQIIDALVKPYCDALPESDPDRLVTQENCALVQTQPLEGFSLVMTISGYGGLMLATPVVLWQLWQFIVPGLYPHEKRYGIPFVFTGVSLFFLGSALAYWSIPRALDFLLNIGGFEPLLSPGPYVSFVVKMLVAAGIGFQFPLILIVLQLVGILNVKQLRSGRRYAVVGIVVLVAILTPSGDPYTLMILSIPMYIFYESAIAWGWARSRRNRKSVNVA